MSWEINALELGYIQNALMNEVEGAGDIINDILHNQAGPLIQEAIQPLIPVSGKHWRGKKSPARSSESLRQKNETLSVTVRSAKNYQYLYFPDDGSNTRRHAGNQQFFRRGAETVEDEIISRCLGALIDNFGVASVH